MQKTNPKFSHSVAEVRKIKCIRNGLTIKALSEIDTIENKLCKKLEAADDLSSA